MTLILIKTLETSRSFFYMGPILARDFTQDEIFKIVLLSYLHYNSNLFHFFSFPILLFFCEFIDVVE